MVKKIISKPGRTFNEFSLLTGYTDEGCNIHTVDLNTKLSDNLVLGIPFLSAAMTSVTGYEMALDLGKERGLGVLPVRLPIEEQVRIVKMIKAYEIGFVEDPLTARENTSIEEVLRKLNKFGHSKIPIIDRYGVFKGMFVRQHYWAVGGSPQDAVSSVMIAFDSNKKISYCNNPEISIDEARALLKTSEDNYLVVLDGQNRLVKLAFAKDVEKIKVAVAISTHKDWEERVKANVEIGADLIVIDTSDAYNCYAVDVIKKYKKTGTKVPICAGNIITYEGAMELMKAGADIVKIGMSSGSICTTQNVKATGRAPMTALVEAGRARKDFMKETGRYVSLIIDGGVSNARDMIIALTVGDAIMMGNYFNRFYEAAGDKIDKNGHTTRIESEIVKVVTYGEGSKRAQNLSRYGHTTQKTFFPEGREGTVKYKGRLKPVLKADILRIKAALANAGCMNLEEFKENAVIELMSSAARGIVSDTHNIKEK